MSAETVSQSYDWFFKEQTRKIELNQKREKPDWNSKCYNKKFSTKLVLVLINSIAVAAGAAGAADAAVAVQKKNFHQKNCFDIL